MSNLIQLDQRVADLETALKSKQQSEANFIVSQVQPLNDRLAAIETVLAAIKADIAAIKGPAA